MDVRLSAEKLEAAVAANLDRLLPASEKVQR
jgi:hypothetical protein